MTDIVERLRSKDTEVMLLTGGPELTLTLSTWHEAADEIERLREALSAMTELFKATETSAQWALSEVERLCEVLRIIAENKNYTSDLLARAALGEKE